MGSIPAEGTVDKNQRNVVLLKQASGPKKERSRKLCFISQRAGDSESPAREVSERAPEVADRRKLRPTANK